MQPPRPDVVAVGSMPPPLHGNAIAFEKIVQYLRRTMSVHVLDTSPGNLSRGVRYHVRRIIAVLRAALHLLRNRKSARVFYHNVDAGFGLYYSIILVGVARLLSYNQFLHHHTYGYIFSPKRAFRALVRLAGKTTTHILLSEKMEADIKIAYPRIIHSCHIGNAALIERFKCSESHGKHLVLGHLSRLEPSKGILDVLRTFEAVANNTYIGLLLAGPAEPPYAQIIENAKRRYPQRIVSMGPVTHEKKAAFFESIDIFLFPTMYENEAQPLVLIEALQGGKPCVAYSRGVIGELLEGSGGHAISVSENFVIEAQKIIAQWESDRPSLNAAARMSRARFEYLLERSNTEKEVLREAILQRVQGA